MFKIRAVGYTATYEDVSDDDRIIAELFGESYGPGDLERAAAWFHRHEISTSVSMTRELSTDEETKLEKNIKADLDKKNTDPNIKYKVDLSKKSPSVRRRTESVEYDLTITVLKKVLPPTSDSGDDGNEPSASEAGDSSPAALA